MDLKELEVNEFQVSGGGPLDRDDIRLVRRRQRNETSKWSVVQRGFCLSKRGEWEYEPIPSSRDAVFLSSCRFDTPEAALGVFYETQRRRKTSADAPEKDPI